MPRKQCPIHLESSDMRNGCSPIWLMIAIRICCAGFAACPNTAGGTGGWRACGGSEAGSADDGEGQRESRARTSGYGGVSGRALMSDPTSSTVFRPPLPRFRHRRGSRSGHSFPGSRQPPCGSGLPFDFHIVPLSHWRGQRQRHSGKAPGRTSRLHGALNDASKLLSGSVGRRSPAP